MGGWEPRQDMECGRKRGGEGKKGGRSGFIRAKRKNGRPIKVKRRPRCAIVFGGGFAPEEIPGRLHGWMERRGVLGWWYMTGLWPSRFPQADLPNSYPPAPTPLPCPCPPLLPPKHSTTKGECMGKETKLGAYKSPITLSRDIENFPAVENGTGTGLQHLPDVNLLRPSSFWASINRGDDIRCSALPMG